jgi:hypothetical protein
MLEACVNERARRVLSVSPQGVILAVKGIIRITSASVPELMASLLPSLPAAQG